MFNKKEDRPQDSNQYLSTILWLVFHLSRLQVLNSQRAHVHESINAVRQTCLLALVQRVVLDGARHTPLPAGLSKVVCSCASIASAASNTNKGQPWEESLTLLNAGLLLLVCNELLELLLILHAEAV